MKTYLQKGNKALLILNHKTSKKVFVNAVVLLKGNINYTIFHLEDGKQKVVAHSIKFYEAFLETHGFLRVHRSYMINPNHVKNLNKEAYKVTMKNGHEAMISRRKKSIFTKIISS
jgi:DNA-binding LytR/AlgR family response regulator